MDKIAELYCLMDVFCKNFAPQMNEYLLAHGKCRQRATYIFSERIDVAGCALPSASLYTVQDFLSRLRLQLSQIRVSSTPLGALTVVSYRANHYE